VSRARSARCEAVADPWHGSAGSQELLVTLALSGLLAAGRYCRPNERHGPAVR
jgi:hypothetical protein